MSGGAIVVGGSRGIGRASAVELARQGFSPLVVGYVADGDAARVAKAEIAALGVEARLLQADASTEAGIEAVVAALDDLGEPTRAVVYSAGYRVLGPTMEHDAAAWRRALDVTLTGFVRTVQATSSRLEAGAKIVGISGISGLRAYSDQHLAMGTAKAASHHAMTYLAWELAHRGINLNMVCCGAVETEGVHRDLTQQQYESLVALARSRIPRGRIAGADEVARLVVALCSPAADLLVGQVIVADGGELLR